MSGMPTASGAIPIAIQLRTLERSFVLRAMVTPGDGPRSVASADFTRPLRI
jgi:hypothetical protein